MTLRFALARGHLNLPLVVGLGVVLSGLMNYLAQILLIKYLAPGEFIKYASGLSQVAIVAGALAFIPILFTKAAVSLVRTGDRETFWAELWSTLGFVLAFVVSCGVVSWLAGGLSWSTQILLSLIAILQAIIGIQLGVLRGTNKLAVEPLVGTGSTLVKLLGFLVFIGLGFDSTGIYFVVIIGVQLLTILAYLKAVPVRSEINNAQEDDRSSEGISLGLRGFLFFNSFFIYAIAGADIYIASFFLSGPEGDQYAVISTFAKIPLMFIMPYSSLIFGRFEANRNDPRYCRAELGRLILICGVVSVATFVFFLLFGSVVFGFVGYSLTVIETEMFLFFLAAFGLFSVIFPVEKFFLSHNKGYFWVFGAGFIIFFVTGFRYFDAHWIMSNLVLYLSLSIVVFLIIVASNRRLFVS